MTPLFTSKHLLASLLYPAFQLGDQLSQRLVQFWSYAWLNAHLKKIDSSTIILGKPDIHGTRQITIGKRNYLYRGLHLETQEHGCIAIGDDVVISRGVHIVSYAHIEIGDGSMIGEYTSLRDANHQFGHNQAIRHSGHIAKPICIGRNVWIGRGVTILPGIMIGDNAIVGANAVVTHDIPESAVVAGIPARPLHSEVAV